MATIVRALVRSFLVPIVVVVASLHLYRRQWLDHNRRAVRSNYYHFEHSIERYSMVRAGAFKFELVQAETKIPFQEHSHAGKVYVEAEPGAEYFLSIQKVDKTETAVYLSYSVDGGAALCAVQYSKTCKMEEPEYKGVRSVQNGVSTHTSLEFVKPKFSDSTGSNERLMMGKVEFKVHEMIFTGRKIPRREASGSKFKAATVDTNSNASTKKKNLRSAEGTNTVSHNYGTMIDEIKIGDLLDTSTFWIIMIAMPCPCFSWNQNADPPLFPFPIRISSLARFYCTAVTLNYCAALGLMEVGAIPKPDQWTHHRMKNPAQPGSNPQAVKDAVIGEDGKTFDLSKLDSDDED